MTESVPLLLKAATLIAVTAAAIWLTNMAWRWAWAGGWHLRHLPAEISHRRGIVHFEAGRYALAIRCFRRAAQWSPKVAATWAMLGQALHQAGRHPEALGPVRRALQLDPGLVSLWGTLGYSQLAIGANDEAVRSLETAMRTAPCFESALALAVARERIGAHADAEPACRRALELRPDDPDALLLLGHLLVKLSRPEEAHPIRAMLLAIAPDRAAKLEALLTGLVPPAGVSGGYQ